MADPELTQSRPRADTEWTKKVDPNSKADGSFFFNLLYFYTTTDWYSSKHYQTLICKP